MVTSHKTAWNKVQQTHTYTTLQWLHMHSFWLAESVQLTLYALQLQREKQGIANAPLKIVVAMVTLE